MSDSSTKSGSKFKSVQALMQDQNPGFGKMLSHARTINYLDQILTTIIDPGLASHCQVAEYRDNCLILVCTNAAFATRLRMISQHLRESFAEEGATGIEQIKIRIAPVNRPQPEAPKKRNLSPAALEALGNFAADSGDADIQAIFDQIKSRRNRQ